VTPLKVTRSTLCAGGYVPHARSPYKVMTTDGPMYFRCPVRIGKQEDPRDLPHPSRANGVRRHVLPGGGSFTQADDE
jgi:hypothetical protein